MNYTSECLKASLSEMGQTLHFHRVALTLGLPQLADMLGDCRQRSAGLATPIEWLDLVF
jgi:hypothetical protein